MVSNHFIQRQCYGFVALNNHGVTLLEKGQCYYAMETFHDALTVVKQTLISIDLSKKEQESLALPIQKDDDRVANQLSTEDHDVKYQLCSEPNDETMDQSDELDEIAALKIVDEKVQRALNRTLEPIDDVTKARLSSTLYPQLHVLSRSVYGLYNHDNTYASAITSLSSPSSVFLANADGVEILEDYRISSSRRNPIYVIRTDLTPEEGTQNDEYSASLDVSLDIETATILYNIGIANVCMAIQQEQHEQLTSHSTSTNASTLNATSSPPSSSVPISTRIRTAHSILDRAARYMKLSQSILQDLCEINEEGMMMIEENAPEEQPRFDMTMYNNIIQTELLVLENIIWINQMIGNDEMAEAATSRYDSLAEIRSQIIVSTFLFPGYSVVGGTPMAFMTAPAA